jgi:hypothetical protein
LPAAEHLSAQVLGTVPQVEFQQTGMGVESGVRIMSGVLARLIEEKSGES